MESLEERRLLTLYLVSSAADAGPHTLRQAILDANTNPGTDTIVFGIGSGPQTIKLQSPLPALTGPVALDATTQPGFAGSPLIELNGSGAGVGAIGLYVGGGGSTIKGLVIGGFSGNGISLTSSGNLVTGDWIGTDLTGTAALANGGDGVAVFAGSNTIGGTAAGAGNVISANTGNGIDLVTGSNLVLGNRIGTSAPGTAALGNTANGIIVYSGGNTIGGSSQAAGNLVSGNSGNGVDLVGGTNLVLGNRVGTDAPGAAAVGNGGDGVIVFSAQNTVGGTAAGAGNLISGNAGTGVDVTGTAATGNLVEGNRIGTDLAGSAALGNGGNGVILFAAANTVGGAAAGAGNLVSGNAHNGVDVDGTANLVAGNRIGTDVTGTAALGNGGDGVAVFATNNTIGGTSAAAGNLVSANTGFGVDLIGGNNVVEGNLVGTDATGTVALGNGADGVIAYGAGNTIGGSAAGAGNVISGNAGNGVALFGSAATGNVVEGNSVGTDAHAAVSLGNAHDGVMIEASASTVGGSTAAGQNVIADNQGNGIDLVSGTGTSLLQNDIFGNKLQSIAQGGTTNPGPGPGPGTPGMPAPGEALKLALTPSSGGPVIHVQDAQTGQELFAFTAFPGWRGPLEAVLADVNGDGIPDVVVVTRGPKQGGRVRIVDGSTGQQLDGPLGQFSAFHGVRGPVSVTVGDFNQDGVPDLFLTARVGSKSETRVYSGATGGLLAVLDPSARHRRHHRHRGHGR